MAGLLAAAGLALCITHCPIKAGEAYYLGDFSVTPQNAWAMLSDEKDENAWWTIDGSGLNDRHFWHISTGVFHLLPRKDDGSVVFTANMLPDDIMEAITRVVAQSDYRQVQSSGLKPASFGNEQGFRFNLTFTSQDGLQYKGVVLFAPLRNKIDAVVFSAPQEYYFDHYAPAVESIFSSIRFTQGLFRR